MQTGKAIGNQMLNESLAALARSGTVEVDEALAKAVDKADLARRLGRSPGEEHRSSALHSTVLLPVRAWQ
jgi:hypothetical protein